MGLRIGSSKVSAIIKNTSKERGQFLFRAVDYDGTVLQEAWLNKGEKIKLVAPPAHDGLTFQEWSSPVTISSNIITMPESDVTVGPTYTTVSGKSEFYITLNSVTGLSMTLNMDGTKDWGDGTTDTETSHTYASAGDYKITCNGTTMTTSSSANLFGGSSDERVIEARIVGVTSITSYAFYTCKSLRGLTLSKGVTGIGANALYACSSLSSMVFPAGVTTLGDSSASFISAVQAIVLPLGVTSLGASALRYCYRLQSVTLPEGLTSVGANALRDNMALERVTFPSTLTATSDSFCRSNSALREVVILGNTIIIDNSFYNCTSLNTVIVKGKITGLGANAFYKCTALDGIELGQNISALNSRIFYYNCNLKSLKFIGNVASIASEAFLSCFKIREYDFTGCTSVPTLAATSAFSSISKLCIIKVPKSLEAEWKAASNWLTYANYIVGV